MGNNTSLISSSSTTTVPSSSSSYGNNNMVPSSGVATSVSSPLYITFPLNTIMELTILPYREVVRGIIYTTDEISNTIVIKKSLSSQHTTNITSEIRVINASMVIDKKIIQQQQQQSVVAAAKMKTTPIGESSSENDYDIFMNDLSQPLPAVNKKSLEERERRAIRLAEESFNHINQKASPVGQAVFDRLVKACNEVVWRGESILVLNQIRVDPPYGKEDCKLLVGSSSGVASSSSGSLHEGSLERVKMIVAAATVRSPSD